jgi:hypothetical protein
VDATLSQILDLLYTTRVELQQLQARVAELSAQLEASRKLDADFLEPLRRELLTRGSP